MKISETRTEGRMELLVEGRVDTTTSPQLQTALLQAFQKGSHVTLDFKGVDYISSSGLRALLIGQKTALSKGGTMRLIHVTDSVMKVFVMTGFSKMLDIQQDS